MSNLFTREYLLLNYASNTGNGYAFPVLREEYAGGMAANPKKLTRNRTGTLLVVRVPATKREFKGFVLADARATGTVVYDTVTYILGTDANLKTMLRKTDLTVKSFEDTTFWNARCISNWEPRLIEYHMDLRANPVWLVEK